MIGLAVQENAVQANASQRRQRFNLWTRSVFVKQQKLWVRCCILLNGTPMLAQVRSGRSPCSA